MRCALIQNGNIVRYQEFSPSPPVLSAEKGLRWVEATEPQYDPATHTCEPVTPVVGDAVTYSVTPLTSAALNARLLGEIGMLEQQILWSGLIRTIVETLITLVPEGSERHAKLVANEEARAALRAKLEV